MEASAIKAYTEMFGKRPSPEDMEEIRKRVDTTISEYVLSEKASQEVNAIYLRYLKRPVEESALKHYLFSLADKRLTLRNLERSVATSDERRKVIEDEAKFRKVRSLGKDVDLLKKTLVTGNACQGLRIKFYGPIGRTGYSQSAKAYFNALFVSGAELSFGVTFLHNLNEQVTTADSVVFSHVDREISYDLVIVEAVPHQWGDVVKKERALNPKVKIVGITLWEADRIHPDWVSCVNSLDALVCCSEWNTRVFSKDVAVPVHTVHNPITVTSVPDPLFSFPQPITDRDYVFYTINEWTRRKGIEDLVDCFLKEFDGVKGVSLYLKLAVVSQSTGERYLREQRAKFRDPPPVVLDTKDLSDACIASIHRKGSCYVSLSKGEGIGLGACEAALYGNPIIMTAYGGQLDYLKGVQYVGFCDEPVNMCSQLYLEHSACRDRCIHYPWYEYERQRWGSPNLEDARRTMRFVFNNRDKASASASLATEFVRQNFGYEEVSRKMAAVLKEITKAS